MSIFWMSLWVLMVGTPAPAQDAEATPRDRILQSLRDRVAPSVVALEVERVKDPEGGGGGVATAAHRDFYTRPRGPVSATVWEADGHVVTTYFNISGEIRSIAVVLPDGTRHPARLLGYDRKRDLALLKIDVTGLSVLPRAASYAQGEFVAVIGRSPDPAAPTLNQGILSACHRQLDTAVQMDAELNYGNVGGPLVNLAGELIGMTSHIRPREPWGQSSGVGFATKVSEIEKMLPRLKNGEKIDKEKEAWIGIQPGEGDPQHEGVEIGQVFPDTPASKAGLKEGDLIIRAGEKKVADIEDLKSEVVRHGVGEKLKLTVLRKAEKGQERREETVEVVLEENPN